MMADLDDWAAEQLVAAIVQGVAALVVAVAGAAGSLLVLWVQWHVLRALWRSRCTQRAA